MIKPNDFGKAQQPRLVLVVEDHPEMAKGYSAMLACRGHSAIVACDGLEAVAIALEVLPDVVLCDLRLPCLDGFGVISALRKNPLTAEMPVCALTGHCYLEFRVREAGFNKLFVKPVSMDDLLEFVEGTCTVEID